MEEKLKLALNRVLSWPEERQEDALELLRLIEEHDKTPYSLTDEQVEEVRRRLAKRGARSFSLAQLDARLQLLGI